MDSVSQLQRAVHAQPGDDDLRRVLADALLDEGAPWGEVIARQLAGEPVDAPLLAEAAPRAFGNLWPRVAPASYRFERGFPVECRLLPIEASDLDEVLAQPAWATLARVSFDERGASGCPPVAPSLVALRGLDEAGAAAVAASPLDLASVGVRGPVDDEALRQLLHRPGLQALEGLDEEHPLPPHPVPILAVRRRRIRSHTTAEWLGQLPATVRCAVLFKTRDLLPPPQSWLAFTRDGDGWRLHAQTFGADGVTMLVGGELDGSPLTFARLDMVGDDGACAAQLTRLRGWMVLPEQAPCPFEIGRVDPRPPFVGDAWHAQRTRVFPPWLVGPAEEPGRRVFP